MNASGWTLVHQNKVLDQPLDLTNGTLYIYSLVPQKVDRVSVGFNYRSYNATASFESYFKLHHYPGNDIYDIKNCGSDLEEAPELKSSLTSVLWELRMKGGILQVHRKDEYVNNYPVINCRTSEENGSDGAITKMEVVSFLGYVPSNSPLFYRYQSSSGRNAKIVYSRVGFHK